MIPIKDHNPSGEKPLFTYILIAINVVVFLLTFFLPPDLQRNFVNRFALTPNKITSGENLYTLISSMFLHGGWGHLIGNMLFLNVFGDNLEHKLGKLKFLFFYIFCGLGASFFQIIVNPDSTIPNLGASGAIAGIMGGYLLLFPRHRVDILVTSYSFVRRATVPAYTMLGYWFIAQLFSGVGSLAYVQEDVGGVAYFAHIGGFIVGYLTLAITIRKVRTKLFSWLRNLA